MDVLGYLVLLPIGAYLFFNVLYLLVLAVAGWLGSDDERSLPKQPSRIRRMAVLIPAYKEDRVIIDSVQANLRQTYPASSYDIFVIADSFRAETLQELAQYPIRVLPVSFEQSTVQKSLGYALNALPENDYDIVVISDADNHMATDFLERINLAFDGGWRAVQGHRVAKNTNTSVAVFDAMNEEVSNHIFRSGQRAVGLSASLIGSGMAFEPATMKRLMGRIRTVGGYDKELEINLLLEGVSIAYLKQALIYDEKVQNLEVFERQRTRWIAAQVHFAKVYAGTGIQQLFQGRFDPAFAFIKALILPRTLLLAALFFSVLLGLVTQSASILIPALALSGTLLVSMFISIPGYLWQKISISDILTFPLLVFRMIRSLLKVKTAQKKFIHTPHGETPAGKEKTKV
ncbi:glycosyltransferase [Tellurirhabdus bombi]|uniref:glycosyltransferase n=1 Tax=Tellurirhabdus bombi TaxID=2907205 RepID=UPI001F44BCB5|nr:glycosyltransferase family 2 protein [Tellurirhabdus bombi]